MANRVPIDWDASQAGKKTRHVIGSIEGLKVGIRAIAKMKCGVADARFLKEIEQIIDHRFPNKSSSA